MCDAMRELLTSLRRFHSDIIYNYRSLQNPQLPTSSINLSWVSGDKPALKMHDATITCIIVYNILVRMLYIVASCASRPIRRPNGPVCRESSMKGTTRDDIQYLASPYLLVFCTVNFIIPMIVLIVSCIIYVNIL